MILWGRYIFQLLLILSFPIHGFGQNTCGDFTNYIPDSTNDFKNTPIKTIKVRMWVLHKSESDPGNPTIEDTSFFIEQIRLVNAHYKKLKLPSYFNQKAPHYIRDSRIRFNLVGINFVVDSVGWNRGELFDVENRGAPWGLDSVRRKDSLIYLKGTIPMRNHKKLVQVKLFDQSGEETVFPIVSFEKRGRYIAYKLKGDLSAENKIWKGVTFIQARNKNCDTDIYYRIAKRDRSAINVFYTEDPYSKIGYGCAPSPYFINMTKPGMGAAAWGASQVLAHEIGHCLGLMHTNLGQFKDYPKNDKYGWYSCNANNVSNNIMGYNKCRNYLSPHQLGYIHKELSTNPRRMSISTICEYDVYKNVEVDDDATWNRSIAIGGDLIVKRNTVLEVKCSVSLPEGSNIYLERKAKLIVNGGMMTNNCGSYWGTIHFVKKYKSWKSKIDKGSRKGKVEFINGGKLKNSSQ